MVAAAPGDAGVAKPGKKKRVPRGHRPPSANTGGGGKVVGGDESGWGGADTVEEGPDEPQGPARPQLVALSAADRAMEWRGDDTSRAPQKVDMSTASETRSLTDGEINDAISSQSDGARDCVVRAATNTDLSGTITVKMIVDGNGRVTKSKVQAPHYMFEKAGLLGCIKGALGSMHFAAVGRPTLVTLPINLN